MRRVKRRVAPPYWYEVTSRRRGSSAPTWTAPLRAQLRIVRATELEVDPDYSRSDGAYESVRVVRKSLTEAGTVLAGRYELIAELGGGGMGKVWLATHKALGRRVAVKILHHDCHADPDHRERFRREARAAGALQHPAIVQPLDFGPLDDGRDFLAMEYVEGLTLCRVLADGGPLSWPALRAITEQVLDGLAFAHDHGIIHRDLKPANLIVEGGDPLGGRTRILDLGIAHDQKVQPGRTLTSEGMVLGTPAYASPEQLRGDPVGPGSDLFSLGVVLYQAMTGERPFPGKTFAAIAQAHKDGAPPPPSTIVADPERPAAFDALVMRMLCYELWQRPTNAYEALIALSKVSREPAALDEPSASVPTWMTLTFGAFLLLTVGGLFGALVVLACRG